ncbi:MAG: flagellar biosynthetic protein FliR [Longimicrobiales bacterium]
MNEGLAGVVTHLWSGFDLFTPSGRAVAALLMLRISALVWTAPVFSARFVPASVKVAVTLVMVALLLPVAGSLAELRAAEAVAAGVPAADALVTITVSAVVAEVLIGIVLGLGAAIFVAAAESAGDMLAVQMGLSGANVLDPMSETQLPVLGQFLGLFVTTLILSVGGHLFILGALATSLEVLPAGAPADLAQGPASVIRLGGLLLSMGMRFAAPVVAAMMIGNAALGILARTVPQLNVLTVAFPVQIALGLIVLGATLPFIASAIGGFGEAYTGLSLELMDGFVPRPAGGG